METFSFDHEIEVVAIESNTFPAGVQHAHETLNQLDPPTQDRKYFDISSGSANGESVRTVRTVRVF